MENYRSYVSGKEVIKVVEDPLTPEGKITIQTIGIAPWGEDHLGFTIVDQAWINQHTAPLSESDRIMLEI